MLLDMLLLRKEHILAPAGAKFFAPEGTDSLLRKKQFLGPEGTDSLLRQEQNVYSFRVW
jgi:hypothetical protein